jgi:hypothetical protein
MVPRADCILQLRAGRLQNSEPGLVHV